MKHKYKVILNTDRGATEFSVEADNDYSCNIERDPVTGTEWQLIGRNRFPLEKVIAVLYLG